MHSTGTIGAPLDQAMQEYFDAAGRDELLVTQCSECARFQFPPRVVCYGCSASNSMSWVTSAGRGTVWSFAVFHKAYFPPERRTVPYTVAVVQLDEGPKLVTNIVEVSDADLTIGMRVSSTFIHDQDGDRVVFRPDSSPPSDTRST